MKSVKAADQYLFGFATSRKRQSTMRTDPRKPVCKATRFRRRTDLRADGAGNAPTNSLDVKVLSDFAILWTVRIWLTVH